MRRYSYGQSRTRWWTAEVWDDWTGETVASFPSDGPCGLVAALGLARRHRDALDRGRAR